LGRQKAIEVLVRRALKSKKTMSVKVRSFQDETSVNLRPCDSDLFVLSQVAGWQDYQVDNLRKDSLNELSEKWSANREEPVIIDAGANVGYSSLYFADAYPAATVLAIEPDERTFEELVKNVARHPRIFPINGALWSNDRGVDLRSAKDDSWSNRVIAGSGGPKVPSFTIEGVIKQVQRGRILILKLDIEGAEREACSTGQELIRNTP